jgi:hypothetical protein
MRALFRAPTRGSVGAAKSSAVRLWASALNTVLQGVSGRYTLPCIAALSPRLGLKTTASAHLTMPRPVFGLVCFAFGVVAASWSLVEIYERLFST